MNVGECDEKRNETDRMNIYATCDMMMMMKAMMVNENNKNQNTNEKKNKKIRNSENKMR